MPNISETKKTRLLIVNNENRLADTIKEMEALSNPQEVELSIFLCDLLLKEHQSDVANIAQGADVVWLEKLANDEEMLPMALRMLLINPNLHIMVTDGRDEEEFRRAVAVSFGDQFQDEVGRVHHLDVDVATAATTVHAFLASLN